MTTLTPHGIVAMCTDGPNETETCPTCGKLAAKIGPYLYIHEAEPRSDGEIKVLRACRDGKIMKFRG